MPASAIALPKGPYLAQGEWLAWLGHHFPQLTRHKLAPRHERLWSWFESLAPGVTVRARVEAWPRGGAKSTTGETATVRVGCRIVEHEGKKRPIRRFVLYVSGTQEQAVKHVTAIAAKFEQLGVGRAVGKYGHSKGWKTDVLRTETGFNVMAMGLEAEARGVKLDDFRPDLIIFDDIDARHDSPATLKRKKEIITDSILPSGSPDCAILFLQNKIHSDSIMSELCDGIADFLHSREPAFVEKAVDDLEYERVENEDGTHSYRITGGVATWDGQDLATCEKQLNDWGRAAFEREAQHETDEEEDGLWQRERDIDPFRVLRSQVPELVKIGVAIDPSSGDGQEGQDEAGIIAAGVGYVNGVLHGYVLEDASVLGSPDKWAMGAVNVYHDRDADVLVAESNNGGKMVEVTIKTIPGAPRVKLVHASRGKQTRAEPIQKLYENGRVHHVGEFVKLEKEQCRWKPGRPSPNRMDALVWVLTELMLDEAKNKVKRKSRSGGFVTAR